MQNAIRKKWKAYLNPVYSPAHALLLFGLVLFHYKYYGYAHPFHRIFRHDQVILLLFYAYSPLVLLFNFVRIPYRFAGFSAFGAFAVTVFGLACLNVALLKGIRHPDPLDIITALLSMILLVVLTIRLLKYMRNIGSVFSNLLSPDPLFDAPREMALEPSPLLALIIIALVPGLTFGIEHFFKLRAVTVSEIVEITGTIVIYLFQLLTAKKEPVK